MEQPLQRAKELCILPEHTIHRLLVEEPETAASLPARPKRERHRMLCPVHAERLRGGRAGNRRAAAGGTYRDIQGPFRNIGKGGGHLAVRPAGTHGQHLHRYPVGKGRTYRNGNTRLHGETGFQFRGHILLQEGQGQYGRQRHPVPGMGQGGDGGVRR